MKHNFSKWKNFLTWYELPVKKQRWYDSENDKDGLYVKHYNDYYNLNEFMRCDNDSDFDAVKGLTNTYGLAIVLSDDNDMYKIKMVG